MSLKTLDTTKLADKTGNLYESVVVLAKRARQIDARVKQELDAKLAYYDDLSLDAVDELRSNEDQARISVEYEKKAKASLLSADEMLGDEIYFRNPNIDE
ncbi:MAG: DNA-directed RNA polymerase subunit omega [Bacteroidota bacterium]